MLTHAICQPTPRARSLQTAAISCGALRPTSTSLLKPGHHHQIRTFRFGTWWSSYFDPEFQRELRHRHRMLKHEYAEALNRKPSWDQHSFDGHSKAIIKHMFRRYWSPSQMRCGIRFVNHDERNGRQQQTRVAPDDEDGRMKTPCAHIRFAQWFRNDDNHYPSSRDYNRWKSRLNAAMEHWTEHTSQDTARAESKPYPTESASVRVKPDQKPEQSGSVSSLEDYIIDPITNRKVPRRTYGSTEDMPPPHLESFRAYRAQFTTSRPSGNEGNPGNPGPIHSDGPPPPAELKKYNQVNIDQVPSHDVDAVGHDGTSILADHAGSPRHPILQSEEYALNHLPPEESAEQYDDFDRYQAYQQTELDERVPESTKTYEDLHNYKTYGAKEAEVNSTEVSPDQAELHKYKPYMHNESAKNESQAGRYDDLGQYGAYKYQEETEKHSTSPKYDDLDKYEHYNDENGKPVNDTGPKYEDLNKYNTVDFNDCLVVERPFLEDGDPEKYRVYKYRELDDQNTLERDIVAESLREFDAKEQESNSTERPRPSIADRLEKLDLSDAPISKNSNSEPLFSLQQGHPSITAAQSREILERSMTNNNKASDMADRDARSKIMESRMIARGEQSHASRRKLTGNYVRDFPEEFSGSWGPQSSHSSLEPGAGSDSQISEQTAHIQAAEKQYADQLSKPVDSAESETSADGQQTGSKLEPALNRRETGYAKNTFNHHSKTQAEVDPYSKEPQGLETSYTKECEGGKTSPTFSKSYGGGPGEVDPKTSSAEDAIRTIHQFESLHYRDPEVDGRPLILSSEPDLTAESSRIAEPTVYKILAYDTTMQKINIAETSSIVPDQATPLTPAEALLRLSNPAKFFPHFAPLQAEGFEIVSGGGDVLVFRQVRSSKAANQDTTAPVNPIDMMGKPTALPSAAAFVSPTGFVNYDIPPVEETQAPPFRSNIDVRKEEPVFSGPKSPSHEGARKARKKSLGKRALIGGAWVAGISYALGVVSEYFITGGADGRGPTGF
ncbi:hypothetical protein F5Y06DRAFT_281636 [Hypoxylon sp. FL0890]|nr:hypothetical protein F5Y06DRAFT_281636 [Hypoxylon sp. FL0890]